ncbi:FtsX-like permease family protein [Amycolatopsis anabasis]|uniref:FtsX-like permease family protein n=1 Tax=Amycolatopsis anabasis TaxID=1840409 RepID=UPI00131D3A3C|nr:FtsX-like permease family protein [Amycolatopsis anabasis]
MLRLALRTLRLRKGGFAATFVAMFFGAMIVLACGGLMETGIRTAVPPQRLAATPIVVSGDQTYEIVKDVPSDPDEDPDTKNATLSERVRIDSGLVAKVQAVPGVAEAIGEVSFPATLLRENRPVRTDSLGHGWGSARLTPYALTAGQAPGPGEVVLDGPLASGVGVGDRVRLAVRGTAETFRVSGIAAGAANPSVPAVFFADSDAARLAGHPGRVDTIGVLPAPGTDPAALEPRVVGALRGAPVTVLTGDDRGVAEFPEVLASGEKLIVLAAVCGGLAALVAMFVVAGTLALSLQQRQRELALLRAIGTTPRQLRRMVLGEAMIVSLLATGIAAVLGSVLGRWLFDQLVAHDVVPAPLAFHSGWIPAVAAAGVAILAALAAAIFAARRAANTRPTEALAEAAVQRRWLTPTRAILAVLCFGGGLALAIVTAAVMTGPVAASTAGPSVMLWAIGLALISPGITRVLMAILRWPLRALTGVNGHLATLNARSRVVAMAAAVTPIMLATGIATANIYLQTTQVAAAEEAYTSGLRADAVVASTTGGLAPGLTERVRELPGVAGASAFVTSNVLVDSPFVASQDDEGMPVQGVSADGVTATSAIGVTAGALTALRGDTVAVPAEFAREIGRGVGDQLTLRMGDRTPVTARIVALLETKPGAEMFLMPADLVAAHTTGGLARQILVRAEPGADLTATLREFAAAQPGVVVGDRGMLIAAHAKGQEIGAWVNYLLVGMIMAYTAISVVNTLVMATVRRRREFGLQRLTGATRSQVLRMMSAEGVLIALVGVLLGTVVAAAALVPFTLVVSDSLLPSGPLWIYLAVIGVAGALTMVATLVPSWVATRGRPAEATVTND